MTRSSYMALLLTLTFGLLSCGGSGSGPNAPTSSLPAGSGETATSGTVSPAGQQAQAGGNFLDVNSFPTDQIISGGVGRDGIPALTDPKFVAPGAVDYLSDSDIVLGVAINGEAKAYPHNIGWWHEIVNDVVGGQPIVVTLCPLTGTGLVFDGLDNNGGRITCGVSGLLFNNNLIMYDRRDGETLYPQITFKGIQGPRTTETLRLRPVIETTWGYWKQLYPNTTVISSDNGTFTRTRYVTYPYGNYRSPSSPTLFPISPSREENPTAQAFAPKDLTLGVRFGETAKAYPFPNMGDEAVINDAVDGNPIVVVWYRQAQLAIPYSRTLKPGTTLTFDKVASTDPVFPFLLKDRETGTTWNLKGQAITGELKGNRLQQVPAHNAFWFAWATFWQNTEIF